MNLREYQREAISKTREALAGCRTEGRRQSVLCVAPTGAGKTVIGAELARLAVERGRRALWLAHRIELVEQAIRGLEARDLRVVAITAASVQGASAPPPVTVASLDTLHARGLRPPADVVILDEAHHGAAPTYRHILDHYRDGVLIGLTATPERSDGAGLGGDLFSRLIVVTTPAQCLADGHLVPMHVIRPARMLRPGQLAQRPVDAWMQHAQGRQTIVFCQSIEHAHRVAEEFPSSAVITGEDSPGLRESTLRNFASGAVPVLCNVAVLTEGVDLPNTSCIIIARGIGTPGLWLQTTGRGSRPAPGKSDCLVLDLRGVSHLHGHPYAPRTYSLDGRGIAPLRTNPTDRWCRVCGAPIAPDEVCADCGYVALERPVKVTGAKLSRYDWGGAAAFANDDLLTRAGRLRAFRSTAARKGYDKRWPYVQYRIYYGETPNKEVVKASYGDS